MTTQNFLGKEKNYLRRNTDDLVISTSENEPAVDRNQAAFAEFLNDSSLTAAQIRFIAMVIEQPTLRGLMEASALYEPPFSNLHAGGPDELFAGKENVIEGVFETLKSLEPPSAAKAGQKRRKK